LSLNDSNTLADAHDLDPIVDHRVPERLKEDPYKLARTKKQIKDNYDVFSREIEISKRIIEQEINNQTKTEAQLKEGLDALEKKKEDKKELKVKLLAIKRIKK